MGNYIIEIGGEMVDVPLSFFKSIDFSSMVKVGKTCFIWLEDAKMTFSIHENVLDRVRIDLRIDLRDSRIEGILS